MIHNPEVNQDLLDQGLRFIQDTSGNQLISWDSITAEDIVIIPAFGTTVETTKILEDKGVNIAQYNTTCPFVEKVWNRSATLGSSDHTIVIHGKHNHEETKATFSHSKENSPSIIVKDMAETKIIADFILGNVTVKEFELAFEGKYSKDFNPAKDFNKIGVVNQTTMLATETQAIADFLKDTMTEKFGNENLKAHFADTRDTLCYATNDNQSSTLELLNLEADLAIVVGGYNSSNTSHLVELLEPQFKTYFIKTKDEIISDDKIRSFNIHNKNIEEHSSFLPAKDITRIIITSGASCPDAAVDAVIQRVLALKNSEISIEDIQL